MDESLVETAVDGVTIETVPRLCGCAGKTPLETVVYPARRLIAERLTTTAVRLAGPVDAALLPRRARLRREVTQHSLDGDAQTPSTPTTPTSKGSTWVLGATFAADTLAAVDRFATAVGDAYAEFDAGTAAGAGVTTIVGKAHSVQLPSATTSRQWLESLHPRGPRREGYWAANVDVIHAFPGLSPRAQAAVAVAHALNDCYAVGGIDAPRVRPLVAVPRGTTLAPETVTTWYDAGSPARATLVAPSIVEHDGAGWLFGASVVTTVTTRPPVRTSAVEPGDAVVLHRPLGALAMYSLTVDSPTETVREQAVTALTADHHDVARVLASFCPDLGEPFDPGRHIKFVTDVSGPGLGGLARSLAPGRLHLTALPFLDHDAVARSRDRWVTPDVTVETNGPLAVVARPSVAGRVLTQLATVAGASPVRIGEVRGRASDDTDAEPSLTASDDVDLGRYIERYARGGR